MTTWLNISTELSLFLDDSNKAAFPEANRLAAFKRAQEMFAITHTARVVVKTDLTITNGTTFSIPSDFLEIAGVRWRKNSQSGTDWTWLMPSERFMSGIDNDDGYVVIGDTIRINNNRSASDLATENVELWYYAGYTEPTGDATVINVPVWAQWAIINLTLAYLLYPLMIGQADLRRFQTKREAGDPEDNPPKVLAMYYTKVYDALVSKFKLQDRSVGYSE